MLQLSLKSTNNHRNIVSTKLKGLSIHSSEAVTRAGV